MTKSNNVTISCTVKVSAFQLVSLVKTKPTTVPIPEERKKKRNLCSGRIKNLKNSMK